MDAPGGDAFVEAAGAAEDEGDGGGLEGDFESASGESESGSDDDTLFGIWVWVL